VQLASIDEAPQFFNPATATSFNDGSLQPAAGKVIQGAPSPGAGRVVPPGLQDGNTVFRYAKSGEPSNFAILDQGPTNGCGTTSLAMVLNYFTGDKQTYDRDKIDSSIRPFNLFSAPNEVAAYAERQGLKVAVHSGTTLSDLHKMVDQGLPVEVLFDISDHHDGSGLHYEVVTGYGTAKDGQRFVELANPWGQREYMAEDAFMARWSNLNLHGVGIGFDRVAIVMKRPDRSGKLLRDDRDSWTDIGMTSQRVAQGITQISSGFARRDLTSISTGVVRTLFGGLTAALALGGRAGETHGKSAIKRGWQDLRNGPVGIFKGAGLILAGTAGIVLGPAAEATGLVGSRVVDIIAHGMHMTGRAFGRLIHKTPRL
jgi:hypothetical protein